MIEISDTDGQAPHIAITYYNLLIVSLMSKYLLKSLFDSIDSVCSKGFNRGLSK